MKALHEGNHVALREDIIRMVTFHCPETKQGLLSMDTRKHFKEIVEVNRRVSCGVCALWCASTIS